MALPLAFALTIEDADTIFLLTEGGPNEGSFQNKGEILAKIEDLNTFRRVQIHVVQVAELAKSWQNFTEPMAAATGAWWSRSTERRTGDVLTPGVLSHTLAPCLLKNTHCPIPFGAELAARSVGPP